MLARMWNVEQWEFTNTPGKSVNLCSHFINKVNKWVVIHSHSEMLFWKKKIEGEMNYNWAHFEFGEISQKHNFEQKV